jgi:hypothetical protein
MTPHSQRLQKFDLRFGRIDPFTRDMMKTFIRDALQDQEKEIREMVEGMKEPTIGNPEWTQGGCCEKCAVTEWTDAMKYKIDCSDEFCPCHQPPTEVSQSEGWEEDFERRFNPHGDGYMFPNEEGHYVSDVGIAPLKSFIRKVEKEAYWAGIKVMDEEADRAISSLLTTLVKEMEKLETKADTYEGTDGAFGFKQGISAAVETITAHYEERNT